MNFPIAASCGVSLRYAHTLRGSASLNNALSDAVLQTAASCGVCDPEKLDQSITENGTHYGIEIFDRVFNNLSTEGLTRTEWLQDFHCPSEQFVLTELDALG